jgi:hypothetical protein
MDLSREVAAAQGASEAVLRKVHGYETRPNTSAQAQNLIVALEHARSPSAAAGARLQSPARSQLASRDVSTPRRVIQVAPPGMVYSGDAGDSGGGEVDSDNLDEVVRRSMQVVSEMRAPSEVPMSGTPMGRRGNTAGGTGVGAMGSPRRSFVR